MVREDHADFFHDGFVFRVGRAHQAGNVVGVGQGNAAFARGDAFDLIGVATLGCARHVVNHAFEEGFGFGLTHVLHDGGKQAHVVRVRARAGANFALVFSVGELFVRVHIVSFDFDFVVNDDAGAGGETCPGDTLFGRCSTQIGGNAVVQQFRFDGLKQAFFVGFGQTGCVDQQDQISGRGCAFSFQAGQNASIVRIHSVDFDTGCLCKGAVQRLVGCIMACRIQVEHFLGALGLGGVDGQQRARHNCDGH